MELHELITFLLSLPDEFKKYKIVNGEFGKIDEDYFYRVDKPILSIEIDENTKEIVFLDKTNEKINKDGDT